MSKKRRRSNKTYQVRRDVSPKTQVKYDLIDRYGKICWCCHNHFPQEKLTIHHIHPYSITHTTTPRDSMILCEQCHFEVVNRIGYDTDEYWDLMYDILHSVGRKLYI